MICHQLQRLKNDRNAIYVENSRLPTIIPPPGIILPTETPSYSTMEFAPTSIPPLVPAHPVTVAPQDNKPPVTKSATVFAPSVKLPDVPPPSNPVASTKSAFDSFGDPDAAFSSTPAFPAATATKTVAAADGFDSFGDPDAAFSSTPAFPAPSVPATKTVAAADGFDSFGDPGIFAAFPANANVIPDGSFASFDHATSTSSGFDNFGDSSSGASDAFAAFGK